MSDDNEIDNTESQAESETVVTNSNKAKKKKLEMREPCPFCNKIMNAKSLKRHIQRIHNEIEEGDHEMDQNEDDIINTEVNQQNISSEDTVTDLGLQSSNLNDETENEKLSPSFRIPAMLDLKPEIVKELNTGMLVNMSKYCIFRHHTFKKIFFRR